SPSAGRTSPGRRRGRPLEDDMRRLHERLQQASSSSDGLDRRLGEIGARLRDLDVASDEWDVLFRKKLLLQLAARDVAARPPRREPAETRARRWFPIRLLCSS